MTLTTTQGKALVQLVASLRRDWQPAGIEAAIRKALDDGANGAEVCVASVRVATDPEARTPGLIPAPGPHWQGTRSGTRMAPIPCNEHPDQPASRCRECATYRTDPETIAAIRKAAQQIAEEAS